jgi:hypothetical protein
MCRSLARVGGPHPSYSAWSSLTFARSGPRDVGLVIADMFRPESGSPLVSVGSGHSTIPARGTSSEKSKSQLET